MKKLILILIILFITVQSSFAEEPKEIRFIYINGSNNNDPKMEKWFFNGVEKLHPHMYKSFSNSELINETVLKNGEYKFSETPETFFWGDRSKDELRTINSGLSVSKMFSPRIAQTVRTLLAHFLHDAIWVSHYRNMHPVVQDLHKKVMENYENGSSVVLFGYSAGSFVTYEYMFNKLPNINPNDYFKQNNISNELKEFIDNNNQNDTCIDALVDSGLAIFEANGQLVPNIETKDTTEKYLKLNEYTCQSCVPKGALKGIVNFGSPLILFYSDISNPHYSLTYYNKLLYKYILENDIFWLTVNYADDPLGYSITKNISFATLKDKIDMPIKQNKGFIYTKSDIKSIKTFIGAHTSYWSGGKKFSKAVTQAYEDGYHLYNDNEL